MIGGVGPHRIDKIDRIDKITGFQEAGFWESGHPELTKLHGVRELILGEVMGHPELTKLTQLTKLQGV